MPKLFSAKYYNEDEIENLEDNEIEFPYSDEYMKYDSLKRQYIPTEQLLLNSGINTKILVNSPIGLKKELENISDQIYSYINKSSGSSLDTLKFMIAKGIKRGMSSFRFRFQFQEILRKQAEFYILNGDPSKITGIDLEKNTALNKGNLINEDRQIDPEVKILLLDLGLLWNGSYDKQFRSYMGQNDW